MSLRRDLEAIRRRLGVTTGPTVDCPRCDGTGLVLDPDQEMRADLARLNGTDPVEPEVGACRLCIGAGRVSPDAAARFTANVEWATEWAITRLTEMCEKYSRAPALPETPGLPAPGPAERLDSTDPHPDSPPPDDDA